MSISHRHWFVLGAGSLGCLYGAYLQRAGIATTLLLRDALRLQQFRHGGLVLRRGDIAQSVAIEGETIDSRTSGAAAPIAHLLLCTKAHQSRAAIAAVQARLAPDVAVVLLQNGLAVEDELRPLLADDLHLLGGLCYICVHRSGPGAIEHQALGAINLAYHSGPAAEGEARQALAEEGAGMFRGAGLDSAVTLKSAP